MTAAYYSGFFYTRITGNYFSLEAQVEELSFDYRNSFVFVSVIFIDNIEFLITTLTMTELNAYTDVTLY